MQQSNRKIQQPNLRHYLLKLCEKILLGKESSVLSSLGASLELLDLGINRTKITQY